MFYKESINFLSEEQKEFLNLFCSQKSSIPFYWRPNAAKENDNGHHFIHNIINKDTGYYNNPNKIYFEKILNSFAKEQKFKIKEIFRCAINYTFYNGKIDKVPVHIDHIYKHKQLLIYLNDSTGDTVVLDKKEKPLKIIKPEKFKGVCFNCLPHYHYFPINGIRKVLVYTFLC